MAHAINDRHVETAARMSRQGLSRLERHTLQQQHCPHNSPPQLPVVRRLHEAMRSSSDVGYWIVELRSMVVELCLLFPAQIREPAGGCVWRK